MADVPTTGSGTGVPVSAPNSATANTSVAGITADSIKAFNAKSFSDQLKSAEQTTNGFLTALKSIGSEFDISAKTAENFAASIVGLESGLVSSKDHFTSFTAEVSKSTSSLNDAAAPLANVINTLGKVVGLDKLTDVFTKVVTGFAAGADHAKQLEMGYVQLISSTGNLEKAFDGVSIDNNFDASMVQFTNDTIDMASESGNSVEAISALRSALEQMPESFDKSGKAISSTVVIQGQHLGVMDKSTAAAKLAAVSSGGLTQVTRELTKAYEDLNLQGQKAMEYVAGIADANRKAGLKLEDTENAVYSITEAFKYLGNNTQGAFNLITQFGPAFKAVGLSSKESLEMITNMTTGIGSLDTASKAFLSSRSGGPGGLQGAFKIDKLIADGKIDEVVKMAEASLKKQLGGNVVTLAQASESQQAAVQYQRQLAFVKSSPFGKLAANDQQASKLFEAMATGKTDTFKEKVNQGSALEEMASRGESLQGRYRNVLSETQSSTAKGSVAFDFNAGKQFRDLLGNNSKQFKDSVASVADQDRLANTTDVNGNKRLTTTNGDYGNVTGAGEAGINRFERSIGKDKPAPEMSPPSNLPGSVWDGPRQDNTHIPGIGIMPNNKSYTRNTHASQVDSLFAQRVGTATTSSAPVVNPPPKSDDRAASAMRGSDNSTVKVIGSVNIKEGMIEFANVVMEAVNKQAARGGPGPSN